MNPENKGKTKILAVTALVSAMGGYICGDKVDEMDKLEQEREPYEIAQNLLDKVAQTQEQWLKIQAEIKTRLLEIQLSNDSLERIANKVEIYERELSDKNEKFQECHEEKSLALQQRKDASDSAQWLWQEIHIRDRQLDSLENIADNFKNRATIENEFQAIHNCVNAHGQEMSSYAYQRQVSCCIKAIKKFQKQYSNNDLKDVRFNCDE